MRSIQPTARGPAALIAIASLVILQTAVALAQDRSGASKADAAKTTEAPTNGAAASDDMPEPQTGAPAPAPTDVPVNLRLRSLEQRVQALKERAWRAKARVGALKEAVLGGGVGARASIVHVNEMGSKFRLLQLTYALDGNQIFSRSDPSGKLHETKRIPVLTGPVSPGSHTLSVVAVYRGHGYGMFRYYNKYRFTVKSSHNFTVDEGKATSIVVKGFEKGGATTPLRDRPAIDFKVSLVQGGKK